ncbi:MAG: glycosyltransferase [Gemmatimonadetes bacterium]|nr:glycosyltransferase [Gemmatimonadota bacterium]
MGSVTCAVHAVVSLRASYGGPARSVPALCDALAARGVRTHLLTIDNAGPGDALLTPRNPAVAVTRVPAVTGPNGLVRWAPRLRHALERAVDDTSIGSGRVVLHDHGLWRPTNRAMARAARRGRLQLVVSTRGMLEPWALAHRAWRKRIAWALYARRDLEAAALLHATSEGEARSLRALGLRTPIAVIPNAVELPAAVTPPDPARRQRQLVFIGRLAPVKGLVTLVEAWALAHPAGWRLAIAGPDEGGHRAEVEQAIARHGVGDSVSLLGPVTDAGKWALLATSDALVLPSASESFGVVVAEALAAGRPAITSTGTPWRRLVAERCGWHVEPTANEIALAIRGLSSLSDRVRAEMGRHARALAQREFSWAGVAARMHAAYDWLLDGGPPPADVRRA